MKGNGSIQFCNLFVNFVWMHFLFWGYKIVILRGYIGVARASSCFVLGIHESRVFGNSLALQSDFKERTMHDRSWCAWWSWFYAETEEIESEKEYWSIRQLIMQTLLKKPHILATSSINNTQDANCEINGIRLGFARKWSACLEYLII